MRLRLLVISLVCAAFAVTTAAAAQSRGLGTVGGQVLAPDGKAVVGARVTLQASEGAHPQTTETNAQGRFWFPQLPQGLYDVRAYSNGRLSEWRHNVWVTPGHQVNVTLRLGPKKPAATRRLPTKP